MARRRKISRRKTGRRRRMGAIGKGAAMQALGIIAGAIIGKKVSSMIPGQMKYVKNGAVLAAGIFLPTVVKGDFGKALGNGMIATGGVGLAAEILPGAGFGQADDVMEFPMTVGEIPDNISVIAGSDDVMAGDDLSVIAGNYEDDED